MDLIGIEPFHQEEMDQSPTLGLNLAPNIDNISKRITNFNSLTRRLLSTENKEENDFGESNQKQLTLTERYAKLSVDIIHANESETIAKPTVSYDASIKTRNAVTMRISKVINNPISDNLIKETFDNVEISLEDAYNLVDSGVTGSSSRKMLRSKVETNLISTQTKILKEFQSIATVLSSLENSIGELNLLRDDFNSKIDSDISATLSFNDKVCDLNKEKLKLILKKELLSGFRKRFTLNVYEEYLLESGDIDEKLFEVLQKCEQIRSDCAALLASEDPKLGILIMEKFNKIIERAINRVLAFINRTLGNLYSLHTTSKLQTLQLCLKFFKHRPDYLEKVIHNFVNIRSKVILEEFLDSVNEDFSLNSRIKDSTSRRLYLTSNDPVQHVGDLLAYVHSLLVNEGDSINNIFTEKVTESEEILFLPEASDTKKLAFRILNSLSKPVRSKIEQILSTETKLDVVYSIYELLDLYLLMFQKSEDSNRQDETLVLIIKDTIRFSQSRFITLIRNRLGSIRSSTSAQLDLNSDLQPPEWIMDFFSDILPVVDRERSDHFMKLPEEENNNFLNLIVDDPITILNEHIKNSISNSFSKHEKIIIKLNFLDLELSKIIPLRLMMDKVVELNEMIETLSSELAKIELNWFLEKTQLYDFFNIMQMICTIEDDLFDVALYQPITENKLFNIEKVNEAENSIKEFLPSALIDVQQYLAKLNSAMIAARIEKESSEMFLRFYRQFRLIVDEYLAKGVLSWSASEVATLLAITKDDLER